MVSINWAENTIRIVNFDDMVSDCKLIIGACTLLGVSPGLMDDWLTQYVVKNIEIQTEM